MRTSLVKSYERPLPVRDNDLSDKAKARYYHSKDLSHLDVRVNGLYSKTNLRSSWVKPACYTALAIVGIGAIALIGISMFPSPPPPPPPTSSTILTMFGKTIEKQTLSDMPRIYHLSKFLSDDECDHLIDLAKGHLEPSKVVNNADQNGNGISSPARTSEGYWVEKKDDDTVKKIEELIAAVTGMPIQNGETLHVLRYPLNGEYRPHHDYFDANTDGGKAILERGGQRVATVIMYLNTPRQGGETSFPDTKPPIEVTAIKGDAVFFYNVLNGKEDPLSLHAGKPVLEGEKWIATKWIREGQFS